MMESTKEGFPESLQSYFRRQESTKTAPGESGELGADEEEEAGEEFGQSGAEEEAPAEPAEVGSGAVDGSSLFDELARELGKLKPSKEYVGELVAKLEQKSKLNLNTSEDGHDIDGISAKGGEVLAQVVLESKITELTMPLGDVPNFYEKLLSGNKTLSALSLIWCGMEEDTLPMLGNGLKQNDTLTTLVIDGCFLTDGGGLAALIEGLAGNTTLKTLRIAQSQQFTDVDCNSLSDWLKTNPTLDHLDLSENFFDDAHVDKMMEGLYPGLESNSGLQSLMLDGNLISDRHMTKLGLALRNHQTLTSLSLKKNKITPAGIQAFYLALAGGSFRLTHLELDDKLAQDPYYIKLQDLLAQNRSRAEFKAAAPVGVSPGGVLKMLTGGELGLAGSGVGFSEGETAEEREDSSLSSTPASSSSSSAQGSLSSSAQSSVRLHGKRKRGEGEDEDIDAVAKEAGSKKAKTAAVGAS